MRYKTVSLPISQLIVTHQGVIESRCNTCKTKDCTNPIIKKKMSIFGVNKECRVMKRGNYEHFVVDCEGYST